MRAKLAGLTFFLFCAATSAPLRGGQPSRLSHQFARLRGRELLRVRHR